MKSFSSEFHVLYSNRRVHLSWMRPIHGDWFSVRKGKVCGVRFALFGLVLVVRT